MVTIELAFLHEIGRLTAPPDTVLSGLSRALDLTVCTTPFPAVAAKGELSWARDPFDRLICAQALAEHDLLLTKDRTIRAHFAPARWDTE